MVHAKSPNAVLVMVHGVCVCRKNSSSTFTLFSVQELQRAELNLFQLLDFGIDFRFHSFYSYIEVYLYCVLKDVRSQEGIAV